jgi:hypothetical protein
MTESQQQMEVRGVKLVRKDQDGKEFVPEIVLWNPVRKRNEKCEVCTSLAHPDFVNAVARLRAHMVILWNADTWGNFEQSDLVEEFEARGFSLKGGGDEIRVTVKGHRKTLYAGAMTANATILLNQDMDKEGAYPLCDDLQLKIKRISLEALLYYYDNKVYEDPQLSLTLPDPPDNDKKKVTRAQVADPIGKVAAEIVAGVNGAKDSKKGKGSKKKVPQSAEHKNGIADE